MGCENQSTGKFHSSNDPSGVYGLLVLTFKEDGSNLLF